jgi:hypothetical protein
LKFYSFSLDDDGGLGVDSEGVLNFCDDLKHVDFWRHFWKGFATRKIL